VAFEGLRTTIYNSNGPGHLHPLNTFQSGELIVIAVHYYAGPAVECALMKDMGGRYGGGPVLVRPRDVLRRVSGPAGLNQVVVVTRRWSGTSAVLPRYRPSAIILVQAQRLL